MNEHETQMPILPKRAYTDQNWFNLEKEKIFHKTWAFAGFIEDVSEPGDYVTVQVGNTNIIVTRERDYSLRAFHNSCRHRGTQLLRSVGKKQKAITCPYHDWTYDLSGELISVPEEKTQFPQLKKKKLCLHKAGVDIWRGMIFVHPDPKAPNLMSFLGDIEDYLGPHDPTALIEYPDTSTEHTIYANWKIVVENYIDGYHLSHLHSSTLSMYDHAKQVTGFRGPHFHFFEPLAPAYAERVEDVAPAPLIDYGDQELGAFVPWIFPTLGLAESESSWSIFHLEPVAPDKTIVRTRTKIREMSEWEYAKRTTKSASFWARYGEGKYAKQDGVDDPMTSGDFMAEDVFACEQQQKGIASPVFSVGATAETLEASVRGFQSVVRDFIEGE